MDEKTLQTFAHLAVEEPENSIVTDELPGLTLPEQQIVAQLKQQKIRLEQERISYSYWLHALSTLQ